MRLIDNCVVALELRITLNFYCGVAMFQCTRIQRRSSWLCSKSVLSFAVAVVVNVSSLLSLLAEDSVWRVQGSTLRVAPCCASGALNCEFLVLLGVEVMF